MQKTCANSWCQQPFEITDEDLVFYDKVSPVFGGKKFAVPSPSLCPDCRQQRRLAWRNERTLYSRDCDLCRKKIVSVYSDTVPFPVYCVSCFWSDRWNAETVGMPYDSSRPFVEQLEELRQRVPQLAIQNDEGIGSENSEYCYDVSRAKDCYRVIGSWYIQDCMYSLNVNQSRSVVDCNTVSINSELVYDSLDSQRLYHCAYLQNCENCSDCFFGYDLKGCKDCLLCYGLRQKQFCIFNEQLTEEEYRKKLKSIQWGSYRTMEHIRSQFEEWVLRFPRKYANFQNCEDCRGNNLFNCKNVLGYSVFNSEHSKFIDRSDGPKYSYDLINTGGAQWCYDCVTPDDSYMVLFSIWCWKSKNILLSDNCHSSESLLGCISLKRGKHCILNKQCSPEEYERTASRILSELQQSGEWGELFPIKHSPFGYNESGAREYYPVTHDQATERGWKWTEALPYTTVKETISWLSIPDEIEKAPDTIVNEIFACADCSRNYKIIPAEFSFYKKIPAPLPRRCPDCRHLRRFKRKNPTKMWLRSCAKCKKEMQTSFSPDRPEIVYCEECYLKAVY